MINIPKSWYAGCLVLIAVIALGVFVIPQVIEQQRSRSTKTSSIPVVNNSFNTVFSGEGPSIAIDPLPATVQVGILVPIRIRAQYEAGIASLIVLLNDQSVHVPDILPGQQALETSYLWKPVIEGSFSFRVRAQGMDGSSSEQQFALAAQFIETNEEIMLEYIAQEDVNPAAVAYGLGICFKQLSDANPTLSEIKPGDVILIPYSLNKQSVTDCPTPDQFDSYFPNLIGVQIGIITTSLYPVGEPYEIARGFGCHQFATGRDNDPRCEGDAAGPNFHAGIDFEAKQGQPITSVTGGVVMHAGPDRADAYDCTSWQGADEPRRGFGNYVMIRKDDLEFYYAHLSEILVEEGQVIDGRGYLIGYAGSTGCSTGPHLHFEIRRNTAPIDPMEEFFNADD